MPGELFVFAQRGLPEPIVFYGVHGGAEWTGASFDPATGWLYVSANELPWIESLSRLVSDSPNGGQEATPGRFVYQQHCAVCHGENRNGQGMIPSLAGMVYQGNDCGFVSRTR